MHDIGKDWTHIDTEFVSVIFYNMFDPSTGSGDLSSWEDPDSVGCVLNELSTFGNLNASLNLR